MGNARMNEKRQELVEDEVALQRWTWEGGSPWDRFGVMEKIEAQLEHRTERTTSPPQTAHTTRNPSESHDPRDANDVPERGPTTG